MAKRKDAQVVKEIIQRYGSTIDLKESPYLVLEIIRQYASRIDVGGPATECLPPGGPPKAFDPGEVIRELKARLAEVDRLASVLQKAVKSKAAAPRRTKATR
jgi:hypothetical protein